VKDHDGCQIEGCDRAHYAKGLCQKHYNATLPRKKYETGPCSVEGCTNRINARGLCSAHDRHQRQGLPLGPLERRRKIVDGYKECAGCEIVKPLSAFCKQRDSVNPRCRDCTAIMNRAYRYKITREEVIDLLSRPCDVCGSEEHGKGNQGHHIDHDHGTGKVRGVLCHRCNVAIGFARNDPKILSGLIAYLERSRT